MLVSRTAGNRSNPWPGPWVQKSLEQLFELKLCNMHVIEEQLNHFSPSSNLPISIQDVSKVFNVCLTIHQQALRCVMHTKFCQLTSLWVNGFVVLNNLYKFFKNITDQKRSYLFIYFSFIFVTTSVLYKYAYSIHMKSWNKSSCRFESWFNSASVPSVPISWQHRHAPVDRQQLLVWNLKSNWFINRL